MFPSQQIRARQPPEAAAQRSARSTGIPTLGDPRPNCHWLAGSEFDYPIQYRETVSDSLYVDYAIH